MPSIHSSKNLYGVTHDPSGAPRIIEPKTVKVGIGLAKGKAMHTYLDLERRWVVVSGFGNNVIRERFDTKAKAQMRYRELKKDAPERKYPERLPYFTFSHVSGSGDFEPDWDVIETHGPIPTEIDVVFVHDDPFSASYQFWTATERKCEGDGKVALRSISMAETDQEKALAVAAERQGEKVFAVTQCWLSGCKYSKPTNDRPAPCRPMGRLLFQLLYSPRLGGTAVFNTSGYKSISQIFSSIEIFKHAAQGCVAGIPLKMVLRPYRISHAGKMITQYAVGLEFRAESVLALKRSLVEQAVQFKIAGREPLKQLEGISVQEVVSPIQEPEEIPAAIVAEFEPMPEIDEQGATQLDPAEDPELGPAGALANAWGDPEPVPPLPPAGDPRTTFYHLCRTKGMTDGIILDHLGAMGYETVTDIKEKDLQELTQWANTWTPSPQGNLL